MVRQNARRVSVSTGRFRFLSIFFRLKTSFLSQTCCPNLSPARRLLFMNKSTLHGASCSPADFKSSVRIHMNTGYGINLDKSEVRGGGRKPYKQKGTGNARLGSKRSPYPGRWRYVWPEAEGSSIKMNKKRRLAMATAIQSWLLL